MCMKFEAEPSLAGFRLNVKNLGGRDTTGWGTSWRAINMMFQRYTGNYSPIHAQDLLPTSLTMLILRFSWETYFFRSRTWQASHILKAWHVPAGFTTGYYYTDIFNLALVVEDWSATTGDWLYWPIVHVARNDAFREAKKQFEMSAIKGTSGCDQLFLTTSDIQDIHYSVLRI